MKAADIMAAAGTRAAPTHSGACCTFAPDGAVIVTADSCACDLVTRARRTAVNLFPLYEAVREAAQFTATRAGDPVEFTHLSPTGPDLLDAIAAYMDRMDDHAERDPYRDGPVSREVQADVRRWAANLRAALDALQAAEDAL